MRTRCPVLIRWLCKTWVALVIGLLALITSLAPLYQTRPLLPQPVIGPSIASAQTAPTAQIPNRPQDALHEQVAELSGFLATCLPLGTAKTKLDIPLFIRCGEKFLSVVDSMVESSCGGPATELALALRYEAQELVASMVLMGLHGSVPSLSAQENAQLVSAGSPLLLRLALLGKSRSLDVSALRGAQTGKSFSPQLRRGLEELSELGREYLFWDLRYEGASATRQGIDSCWSRCRRQVFYEPCQFLPLKRVKRSLFEWSSSLVETDARSR